MSAIFARDFDRETDLNARERGGVLSEEALREIRAEAFESGRAVGLREAEARMRDASDTLRAQALTRIGEAVSALLSEREVLERALEAQLLDYAIAIGEKVLPDLIETRAHQHVISQIRRAVRMGLGSAQIRIRLSGPDRDLLEGGLGDLGLPPDQASRVRIETDEGMGRGELRVDWDKGGLSYSFSAICDEIISLLRNAKSAPIGASTTSSSTIKKRTMP